ncbi:hypothetical protein SDC9_64844 [bioreactor metagenome]|uniref:Uncharacterized protein n=1 Tax=bioreactor metagenome TaxID=1076179 RepID=A0A644XVV7_9ZZZZ
MQRLVVVLIFVQQQEGKQSAEEHTGLQLHQRRAVLQGGVDENNGDNQGNQSQPAVGHLFAVCGENVNGFGYKVLSAGLRGGHHAEQQDGAKHKHGAAGDETNHRAAHEVVQPQRVGGNGVVNLGCAGRHHGEGGAAEGKRARDEPPGKVGLTEHLQGDGEHREAAHKYAHAAVSQHGAGKGNGNQGLILAEETHDKLGDGLCAVCDLHHLAHEHAGEEDQVVGLKEFYEAAYKGDLQRVIQVEAAGERNDGRADKGDDKNIDALHNQVHQQTKTGDNTDHADQNLNIQSTFPPISYLLAYLLGNTGVRFSRKASTPACLSSLPNTTAQMSFSSSRPVWRSACSPRLIATLA